MIITEQGKRTDGYSSQDVQMLDTFVAKFYWADSDVVPFLSTCDPNCCVLSGEGGKDETQDLNQVGKYIRTLHCILESLGAVPAPSPDTRVGVIYANPVIFLKLSLGEYKNPRKVCDHCSRPCVLSSGSNVAQIASVA